MNNRRSFFKSLIGLIVAPKVAKATHTNNLVKIWTPKTGITYGAYIHPGICIRQLYSYGELV
jgi:hypothetical protein